MKIIIGIGFLVFCFASNSFGATVTRTGKITSVKMFSNVFVIYVDNLDPACGGSHKRVAIRENDPLFATIVSTALTAKATGAEVEMGYLDQCTKNGNAWDFKHFWLK